jgi:hypothetical protein
MSAYDESAGPAMGGGGPAGLLAAAQGAPPDAGAEGGGEGSNSEDMRQVKDLLRKILENEPDEQDSLLLEKMLTEAQQYLANEEKLVDTALGAGPGARLLRKTQGTGGGI